MKKIKCTLGLIIPSIAINVIAHDIVHHKAQAAPCSKDVLQEPLSSREQETLELYSKCSPHERAVFLWKVIESSSTSKHTSEITTAQIRQRVESILLLSDTEQEEQLIREIRCGGVRWGSIGAPSEKSI